MSTARITYVRPEFVEAFPQQLEPGRLYISIQFRTTGHLCCCGCGEEVIAPLSPAQWSLTYDGLDVSLSPSIGSWSLPCKSHYWIRKGTIQWSRKFTDGEIRSTRRRDFEAITAHVADRASNDQAPESWISKLWRRINRG